MKYKIIKENFQKAMNVQAAQGADFSISADDPLPPGIDQEAMKAEIMKIYLAMYLDSPSRRDLVHRALPAIQSPQDYQKHVAEQLSKMSPKEIEVLYKVFAMKSKK